MTTLKAGKPLLHGFKSVNLQRRARGLISWAENFAGKYLRHFWGQFYILLVYSYVYEHKDDVPYFLLSLLLIRNS